MDKNTFTGLFLIMIIMGASIFFMKPNDADIKKEAIRMHADSAKKGLLPKTAASATKAADTAKAAANIKVDSAILKSPFGAATVGTEKLITLENKNIVVKLT